MLRGPIQNEVARSVLDSLINDAIPPGARVNEQAMARTLGVSRTPVRAVLMHLAEEGILERRPRQGFFLARKPQLDHGAALGEGRQIANLHERLLRDMLLGKLDRTFSQNALMRRYEVGRGELLMTLRRLTREGLAEPAPGHGWTFTRFGADVIENGYRLRLIVEPAVLLNEDYVVDEAALGALRADHAAILRRLSPTTPWDELFNLDARFHAALSEGARNELVTEIIHKQNRIRRLCEYLGYERIDRVQASLTEHQEIIDSLLDGDRKWASALLHRHLTISLNQSLTHFAKDIQELRDGKRRFEPDR